MKRDVDDDDVAIGDYHDENGYPFLMGKRSFGKLIYNPLYCTCYAFTAQSYNSVPLYYRLELCFSSIYIDYIISIKGKHKLEFLKSNDVKTDDE